MFSGFCRKSFSEAWSSLSIQTDLLFSSCYNALLFPFLLVSGRASSSIFCFTYLRTRTKPHTFVIFKTRGLCSQYMLQRLKANATRPPAASCCLYSASAEEAHTARSVPLSCTRLPRALFSPLFVFWRLLSLHKYGEMRIKKHRNIDSLKFSISKYRIGCTFPISMKNIIESRDNVFP